MYVCHAYLYVHIHTWVMYMMPASTAQPYWSPSHVNARITNEINDSDSKSNNVSTTIWVWLHKYIYNIYIYAYRSIQKGMCVRVCHVCTVVFTGKYLNYKVPRCSDRAIGSHKVSNKSTWLIKGQEQPWSHEHTCHNNSTKQWHEKAMWTWNMEGIKE